MGTFLKKLGFYLWFFLFVFSAYAGEPILVDGTAATVGKILITVQDLYFYRALMRFREGSGDPLSLEDIDALKKTAQKVIFEEMVFQEMKSFSFDGGSRAQADDVVKKQNAGDKGKKWKGILKAFGKNEKEAVDRLFKTIQVEKFIQKKVETLTPIITQAEIEQYFSQNREKSKDSSLEALKPSIEVLLKKDRMKKGLEEWIRFLRDKYGLTNHLAS